MTDAYRIQIRNNIEPGDIEDIISLHGSLYAREYGFDETFEQYVAEPLHEFAMSHTHTRKNMDRGTETYRARLSCCRKKR